MVDLKFRTSGIQVAGLLIAFVAGALLIGNYVGDSHTVAGVLLGEPINMSVTPDTEVDFCFYPVIHNGTINRVELWTNETGVMALEETNSTTVLNATENCITHIVSW